MTDDVKTYRQAHLGLCPYFAAGPQPHAFFCPGQNHPGEVHYLSTGPPRNITVHHSLIQSLNNHIALLCNVQHL